MVFTPVNRLWYLVNNLGITIYVRRNDIIKMSDRNIDEKVSEVRTEGFCILQGCLPVEVIDDCNSAFQPVLRDHAKAFAESPNRGPMRHYIPLRFEPPFYDKRIFENEAILGIVGKLLGDNTAISEYSTDTPLNGSVLQDIHQDLGILFHEDSDFVHPPEIIAVNFPYVDVTPDRGPFEIARGTHHLPYSEALRGIEEGKFPLEPLFMNRGDVMIRNPRCLHRGTPNKTDTPRVMAVIGFNRWWLDRSRMASPSPMKREVWNGLSDRERNLLRVYAGNIVE